MKKFKGIPGGYSMSYTWTQSYPAWPNPIKQVDVMNEIARLDYLEEQIQEMTEYPEAMAIINKLKG